MNRKEFLLVLLLFTFSMFFRCVGLEKSPPSINFDEASLGYNAYSILKTGKDEYGNFLPISLRSFNDYKPALYAYISIPFIWLMDLNETSTRLPSALMGSVSIVFLYLIAKKFVKKRWLIWVMFLVSLQPWRLHYSRVAFESNVSMAFFTMGMYGWLNFKKGWKWLVFSAISFILSIYSYHGARLAVPVFLALSLLDPIKILFKKNISFKLIIFSVFKNKKVLLMLAIIIFSYVPIFIESSKVLTRFNQTSVFTENFPYVSREMVDNYGLLIKPLVMGYHLLGIMFGHLISILSPSNLGLSIFDWVEKSPMVISGMGMMGFIESLLVIIGVFIVFKGIKQFRNRSIVYWLVASTTPVALTLNWYHPLRSLNAFPVIDLLLILALSCLLSSLLSLFSKKLFRFVLITGVVTLFTINSIYVVNNELIYSPWTTHGQFQPGAFKEGAMKVKEIEGSYDKVYVDTSHAQSYVFFWFYQKRDPVEVQSYADLRPAPGENGKFNEPNLIFDFGKYVYKKYDWLKDRNSNESFIYWVSGDVKKDEIEAWEGATYTGVPNILYDDAAVIITKEKYE